MWQIAKQDRHSGRNIETNAGAGTFSILNIPGFTVPRFAETAVVYAFQKLQKANRS
jgi:hypothetical protein